MSVDCVSKPSSPSRVIWCKQLAFRKARIFYYPRPRRFGHLTECCKRIQPQGIKDRPTPSYSLKHQAHQSQSSHKPPPPTMLFSTRNPRISINLLAAITTFIFSQFPPTTANGICSQRIFGNPRQLSCEAVLVGIPQDTVIQYFVEQQLRRQPGTNWVGFGDPRPPSLKQKVVEVPKWWSVCSYQFHPISSSSPRANLDAAPKAKEKHSY